MNSVQHRTRHLRSPCQILRSNATQGVATSCCGVLLGGSGASKERGDFDAQRNEFDVAVLAVVHESQRSGVAK